MTSATPPRAIGGAVDWIAVDWSPTLLRAWAMGADGGVRAEARRDVELVALAPGDFEPALISLIDPWLDDAHVTPVIASGVLGAREAWIEAPYRAVPCAPPGPDVAVRAPVTDGRFTVAILPGLAQSRPADVMRGTETQVAGFLANDPDFDGTLCLPGPQTRWVQVSAGEIVSFRTVLAGDLFAAISGHTVLRDTVGAGTDQTAFLEAVADALARPEALTARLFSLHAERVLGDVAPGTASARVSGLLIGVELAGARGYWLGTRLAVIGTGHFAELYADALAAQGVTVERADADTALLAGLRAAHGAISGDSDA